MIFDTHAHYDDEDYNADREAIFHELREAGVTRVTNIAVDMETSRINDAYTKQYDFMYGTVGVFPTDVQELEVPGAVEELERLLTENPKLVAVGEIGLDYHYDNVDKALQQKWFAGQMELARRMNKPIAIHSREAARDTADIMKSCHAEEIGGVMHCYSYTKEMAREFLDMGFYFGIGGVVTFKNAKKLKEAVAYIPLTHIVMETDAPYLTPEPYRGKRNSSAYLPYVAQEIARIKEITVDAVYAATYENACKMYRVP